MYYDEYYGHILKKVVHDTFIQITVEVFTLRQIRKIPNALNLEFVGFDEQRREK